MSLIKKIIVFWLPPIIWMIIIFYLSSQMRISITHQYLGDFIIFKSLHMIEYAFLYYLWVRAFTSIEKPRLSNSFNTLVPLIITAVYAVTDEIHQTFVPTRQGIIRDIFIDWLGIFFMYIIIRYTSNQRKILS